MNQKRQDQLINFMLKIGLDIEFIRPEEKLLILDAALTHTSAGLGINHEKLEFLGDAVLRLAATEFLEIKYPNISVGEGSTMRAQLVSDRWLSEVGAALEIESFLVFGPKATGDSSALETLRAEACEASIGALYRMWGNLSPVMKWLTPYWQKTANKLKNDPSLYNWKSALQEWSQGQKRGLPEYNCKEISQIHADPRRFHCQVSLGEQILDEGWGRSRRQAEQESARAALSQIRHAQES